MLVDASWESVCDFELGSKLSTCGVRSMGFITFIGFVTVLNSLISFRHAYKTFILESALMITALESEVKSKWLMHYCL